MATNENNNIEYKKAELREMYGKYRGEDAVLLTRVSSGSQSHEAQERVIRELLIENLGLRLKAVKHCTYTGLEYRYNKELAEILEMAEHEKFVLCLDVLDRGLGRKGVSREIFRGQLRELGIHILTTEKSDHSDDDSLEGQLMRLLKGYKAEEEVNDFVRRTRNGKRDKALGNPEKGVLPRVIGNGGRTYGYKYVYDEKGKIATLEPNHTVIWIDSKGVEWTEVRVMIFMFRCSKRCVSLRKICKRLNDIGIPSPCISVGRKYTSRGVQAEKPLWQVSTVSKMLRNRTYSGKMIVNSHRTIRFPGEKYPRRVKTTPEEQITIPVPAIVSVGLQEQVINTLKRNKQYSMRNNRQKFPALMRSGLAKCGNCGRTAFSRAVKDKLGDGQVQEHLYYRCQSANNLYDCPGCHIKATIVDTAAWDAALGVIHNPSKIDKALEEQKTKDPVAGKIRIINQRLTENRRKQRNLRINHIKASEERELDIETIEEYNIRIKELKREEQQFEAERTDSEKIRQEWEATQRELERLHRKCAVVSEKLKKPGYEPDYREKRDIIEFLGIHALIWEKGHINPESGKPERVRIQAKFADIVLILS